MALYLIVNVAIVVVLGLVAMLVGERTTKDGGFNFNYTTRDIVIIAVIAAIAGVVNTGAGNLWYLMNTSLGPLGGALLQGSFMWAYILVMFLVRRPGAALLVGLIETAVELLLGNAAGIGTLGWGLTQGIAVEAVVAFTSYRKFDLWTALAAGAAASQFGTVWTAIFYGWDPATANDVWLAVPVNIISGIVLSGLIGYLLSRAIAQTGLVRSAAH
ncbi:MAG: ECF transporter S component [Aggregatilineales bacterium]|nr:ECF transporter S component [Aggregatilineales bacterium]HPV07323.1 ECF transporter S component [Aggregatilineales bacterium]HQE18835.1 ECF transporter S component [Aggregatilineales bacterium]